MMDESDGTIRQSICYFVYRSSFVTFPMPMDTVTLTTILMKSYYDRIYNIGSAIHGRAAKRKYIKHVDSAFSSCTFVLRIKYTQSISLASRLILYLNLLSLNMSKKDNHTLLRGSAYESIPSLPEHISVRWTFGRGSVVS